MSEIANARLEADKARQEAAQAMKEAEDMDRELAAALARIEVLEEALRFYANANNWDDQGYENGLHWVTVIPAFDGGEHAVAALANSSPPPSGDKLAKLMRPTPDEDAWIRDKARLEDNADVSVAPSPVKAGVSDMTYAQAKLRAAELFRQHKELSYSDLIDALGLYIEVVAQICSELETEGLIREQ